MVPKDDFTPYGYLDNPYHSWKLNPSGVLRSAPPLGMGWHVPNLGSYVRNQFQYTAHLHIGLKIGSTILITPTDFKRHGAIISSHLHTKNRFGYTCYIAKHCLTLTARYFLINEDALGCILTLATTASESLPITCYLMHQHTHNPYTSRLWEHGLYVINAPQEGVCMLGIASEGDVFVHGARSADGRALTPGAMDVTVALEDAAIWAHGIPTPRPSVTEREESTGWLTRTAILPYDLTLEGTGSGGAEHIINAVLTRGVSQDQSYQRWLDGIEEIVRAEAQHRADDQLFWSHAPQLSGDWPPDWRRGLVYDLETLRMVLRPSVGLIASLWDGMQIQAPRTVLAEAAMDMLFLSYAEPDLAAEAILGHFELAPRPNLPCMREDGSYNMVADDGQICGTAPEWGYPIWCCNEIWRRTGDLQWLRRLYPPAAAYLRWWLEYRRDSEGWLTYACSWESGQDVSRRFGPQQTGGTIIQHVRPVDLQASMAQSADILTHWAQLLTQANVTVEGLDLAFEVTWWHGVAQEFSSKTRQMWQQGWFRDYDAVAQEWSSQQDTMHLAALFCGTASQEQRELLHPYFSQPPLHSGWAPLSWPPVVMTLVGAAIVAGVPQAASELAYRFIDASYRSTDRREPDEDGGWPGVTREYRRTIAGVGGEIEYANAGIEGYGWGALSIHLLIRHLFGLHATDPTTLVLAPTLPQALRRPDATYTIAPIPWGKYILSLTCQVKSADGYQATLQVRPRTQKGQPATASEQEHQWEGTWGEERIFQLSY